MSDYAAHLERLRTRSSTRRRSVRHPHRGRASSARFDPDAVRSLVASADRAVSVGGPTLAVEAFRAGLVDEVQLFVVPVSVGGGTPAFPRDLFVRLELRDEHRFTDGTVYLDYAVLEPR